MTARNYFTTYGTLAESIDVPDNARDLESCHVIDLFPRIQASNFLRALDPEAKFYTFQTFDDNADRKLGTLARVIHGTFAECRERMERLNRKGAGIYVTINETDGKGRKKENIVRVRATFADLDGAPLAPVLADHPDIVNESSPGRFHVFWLGEVPLADFTAEQKRLAKRYGGDPAVSDLPRVLRLPGFTHQKGKPFVSRIVSIGNGHATSDNTFVEHGESTATPSAAELLEAMHHGNVHTMQTRAGVIMFNDRVDDDEIVETIIKRERELDGTGDWNWDAEEKTIRDDLANLHKEREAERKEEQIKNVVRPIVIKPHDFPPASTMAMFDWLYGHHLRRGDVAGTAAPGGVGKSTMSIIEGLCMASGKPLLQQEVKKPLRTLIINLEDDREVMNKRIEAARDFHNLTAEEFGGRLSVLAKGEIDFLIATMDRGGRGVKRGDAFINELKRVIIGEGIDVISVDPFIRTHGVPENDNNAIKSVVTYYEEIARECGVAISLWHHARKGKGGNNDATVDDARGASSFVDACRSVRILELLSQDDAKKLSIADHHRRYFHAVSGKLNYAPPVDDREWYHLASFELLNKLNPFGALFIGGDSIGVIEKWSLPVAKAMTEEQVALVLKEVEGTPRWKNGSQSGMWVGIAVATALDLDADKAKAAIKQTVAALIADKKLKRIDGIGPDRHPCVFVVPFDMQEPKGTKK